MNDSVGNNLEKALRECSSAAQKGYEVAKDCRKRPVFQNVRHSTANIRRS